MQLIPLYDGILIKQAEAEEVSTGGIIIPDSVKQAPLKGEVLSVGEGAVNQDGTIRPLRVKVGDTVLYSQFAGSEVIVDGEERLMVREQDVLAILR
jgi:chaperonin GroES